MSAKRFKTGNKAVVSSELFGHGFEIGTIVTLENMGGNYYAKCEKGVEWSVQDEELDAIVNLNILGTDKNLLLYGSSGEVKYSFLEIGETIQEVYYDEKGIATKFKEYKICR